MTALLTRITRLEVAVAPPSPPRTDGPAAGGGGWDWEEGKLTIVAVAFVPWEGDGTPKIEFLPLDNVATEEVWCPHEERWLDKWVAQGLGVCVLFNPHQCDLATFQREVKKDFTLIGDPETVVHDWRLVTPAMIAEWMRIWHENFQEVDHAANRI